MHGSQQSRRELANLHGATGFVSRGRRRSSQNKTRHAGAWRVEGTLFGLMAHFSSAHRGNPSNRRRSGAGDLEHERVIRVVSLDGCVP